MPIYTYQCRECKFKFDVLTNVNSDTEELFCRKCKSRKVEKIFSSFSISNSGRSHSEKIMNCPPEGCQGCNLK